MRVINKARTGKLLRDMRRYAKFTIADIAEWTGRHEKCVIDWERGAQRPALESLLNLAAIYDLPMEDLLVWEESEDE